MEAAAKRVKEGL